MKLIWLRYERYEKRSADVKGSLKVWIIEAGLRQRAWTLDRAATALAFGASGVAAGLSDGSIRTFGAKSGALLNVYRGHAAFVSAVAFVGDPSSNLLASASADATVKLWRVDASGGSALQRTLALNDVFSTTERPVAALLAPTLDTLLAVQDDKRAVLWHLKKTTQPGSNAASSSKSGAVPLVLGDDDDAQRRGHFDASFVSAAALSHQGRWLYCVGGGGKGLAVYDLLTSTDASTTHVEAPLRSRIDVSAARPTAPPPEEEDNAQTTSTKGPQHKPASGGGTLGLAVHPYRSLVATFGDDETLRLWKA